MILLADIHFGVNVPSEVGMLKRAVFDDPDRLLILAGDLTASGAEQEFCWARQFLDTLLERQVRVIVTPGNHDLHTTFGGTETHPEQTSAHDEGKRQRRLERMRRLCEPVFQQQEVIAHGAKDAEFDTLTHIGTHLFITLRSAQRFEDQVSPPQIAWAATELSKQPQLVQQTSVHVVTHHALWPGRNPRMLIQPQFEAFLARFRVHAFIHGHNHDYLSGSYTVGSSGYRVWRISLPTLQQHNPSREQSRGFLRWFPPAIPEFIRV